MGESYRAEVDLGMPSGTEIAADQKKRPGRGGGTRSRRKPGECGSQHQLVGFQVGVTVEPLTKAVVPTFAIHCCHCGRTLEEVRKEVNAR